MSMGVSQVYRLRFKIGDQDVSLTPAGMNYFEINMYLDRFLPTISCELRDVSGFLTHLTPHDSRYNTLGVNFANDMNTNDEVDIKFKIFRRKPQSILQSSNNIAFSGILDIKNMFNPNYEKGWSNSTIKEVVEDVIKSTTFDSTNVVTNTGSKISIIQPNWTNAQFLTYLADYTKSDSGDSAFLTFCDLPGFLKTRFNFVSLTSLLKQKSSFTYMNVAESRDESIIPIYKVEIIDNFDLISNMGVSQQVYGYFDYFTGTYVSRTIKIDDVDFKCLSEYFSYDSQDNIEGLSQNYVGVTNDFTSDYDALARGNYYKKLNSLVKMWISSPGNPKVNPGDIVTVIFPEAHDDSSIVSYQYSGNWLVERVKHAFGSTYVTSLLLTRPGFDTDKNTTFVKAKKTK